MRLVVFCTYIDTRSHLVEGIIDSPLFMRLDWVGRALVGDQKVAGFMLKSAFRYCFVGSDTWCQFPIRAEQSTLRFGPIRPKTHKPNLKKGCTVLAWQTYAGCLVHTKERKQFMPFCLFHVCKKFSDHVFMHFRELLRNYLQTRNPCHFFGNFFVRISDQDFYARTFRWWTFRRWHFL